MVSKTLSVAAPSLAMVPMVVSSRPPVLVAVVLMAALAGCLTPDTQGGDTDITTDADDGTAFEPVTETFSDTFRVAPADGPFVYPFEVPNGTGEIEGILTWSAPGASLGFTLRDPDGDVQATGWGESDTHRYVTTTAPPVPGAWEAVVTASRGANVAFALDVTMREAVPYGPIDVTYEVPARDFVEINLNMMPNDTFGFSWSSGADLYFNVHFHGEDGTERPIESTGTALAGNFTAPATEVYSLLWRNEGALPVTVEVSVDGTYRLHSMTRDAPDS